MQCFLKNSRKLINTTCGTPLCLVIGNESCDLDSAVSALALAYFYQGTPPQHLRTKAQNFLPVLNIPRRDYALKTEVKFLFQQHAILEEHLTFRDELKDEMISAHDCILVDHHASPLAPRCVEVFDHRPRDLAAQLPPDCCVHLESVGSCATLIAEVVLAYKDAPPADILRLLRAAIVLDTVNFEPKAGRATPKDQEVCARLETALGDSGEVAPRPALFEALCRARADIDALTPAQLLRKDLKILAQGSLKVALPGFPLLVQEFIRQPGAATAVADFANENHCAVILLIGMRVLGQDNEVRRDLALINIDGSDVCAEISRQLRVSKTPNLELDTLADSDVFAGEFYTQRNVKVTRKHILPIVKEVLQRWTNTKANQIA